MTEHCADTFGGCLLIMPIWPFSCLTLFLSLARAQVLFTCGASCIDHLSLFAREHGSTIACGEIFKLDDQVLCWMDHCHSNMPDKQSEGALDVVVFRLCLSLKIRMVSIFVESKKGGVANESYHASLRDGFSRVSKLDWLILSLHPAAPKICRVSRLWLNVQFTNTTSLQENLPVD